LEKQQQQTIQSMRRSVSKRRRSVRTREHYKEQYNVAHRKQTKASGDQEQQTNKQTTSRTTITK